MKAKWIEHEFPYDGSQLRSLFAYLRFNLQGDSIVSWVGPCEIPAEHMLDGEDLNAGAEIRGSLMLHFVAEKFHQNLFVGVSLQRLLASLAKDVLGDLSGKDLSRTGDDLYWKGGKLSISVASQSPVSTLIHFAVNISNDGTPVETASLEDLGVSPEIFGKKLMENFCAEALSIKDATEKVKPVL